MESLWNDQDAQQFQDELALRVYSSRLLGQNDALVLHGGGNTSVKIKQKNILGNDEVILYVKGSGWDLKTIEAAGFSPVKMDHLLALAKLEKLSDPQMVNELKTHCITANAPAPSVEAILHAILPYKYVDHTHADAIVTITNTPSGLDKIQQIYGNSVVIIPYIMPGFDLARLCAETFQREASADTIGMILMNHGIFSFGDTAKQSYERMIELVSKAEHYLESQKAWTLPDAATTNLEPSSQQIVQLRQRISHTLKKPIILSQSKHPKAHAFANHSDVSHLSQQGPATPDHIIRTKQRPMLGDNLAQYTEQYTAYFKRHAPNAQEPKTMLDSMPRVILDPALGMLTVGQTIKEAMIVQDIYHHTIDIILRASLLGGYQALPEKDLFDMEYWDLEQAKLRRNPAPPLFAGEIAFVTGAASGIGKATVKTLLDQGAAVTAIDIDPNVEQSFQHPAYLGITCDVTDETHIQQALQQTIAKFGGLDMMILCAGVFPASTPINQMKLSHWQSTMSVNLDANLSLLRESHPFLSLSPSGGRVVIIGSKNIAAPGPGAAAYSASKAALNQLGRVTALEWGKDNIRVNMIHPDAVFDTKIWTEEVLAARAKHYGMSIAAYKTKNILQTEIQSIDVAQLVATVCGSSFAKTTAAQIPIDGGNDRVI